MRKLFAILIAKMARLVGRAIGRGSSQPGALALKIDPNILQKIQYPPCIVAVSGSNGKTATVEMLARALSDAGLSVVYNREGSNQIEGVATLVLEACTLGGKLKKDVLLFEADERFARLIFRQVRPSHFLLTNLFRDQLTRNGHPEWVYDALAEAAANADRLLINADDPLLSLPGEDRCDTLWYGAQALPEGAVQSGSVYDDGRFCPRCGGRMTYAHRVYHHLGSYRCPACGYGRHTPEVALESVDPASGALRIRAGGETAALTLHDPSLYAAYNVLAAFALAHALGVSGESIAWSLNGFISHTGRIVPFRLGGHPGQFLISKHENSVSYDQSIAVITARQEPVAVLVIVDRVSRKYYTSETSWLWDVDFGRLNAPHVRRIVLAGAHYADLAVRFAFTGIPPERIRAVASIDEACGLLADSGAEKLYTVTCFSDKEKFLKAAGGEVSA